MKKLIVLFSLVIASLTSYAQFEFDIGFSPDTTRKDFGYFTHKYLTKMHDVDYWEFYSKRILFQRADSSHNDVSFTGIMVLDNKGNIGRGSISTALPNSGVTAGTYEYVTVDAKGIVNAAYNSTLSDLSARTSGTAYQASSTTRIYDVDFTVKIHIGAALISSSDGQVVLEVSPNGSSGWTEYSRSQNSNGGLVGAQNDQVGFVEAKNIPAGYYYRVTFTQNSGTASWTYIKGHELLKK